MSPGHAGTRAWWAAPILLAGYLLTGPKGFVLGPLALLLILSHPRTLREWLWIGISLVLAVTLLRLPATLAERTVWAAAAFFTGAFVMASVAGVRSLFRRALTAVVIAAGAVTAWFATLGLSWGDLRESVVTSQWTLYRALLSGLPETMPSRLELESGALSERVADLTRGIITTVDFWPAIHAVLAMAGGWLAWNWYHRVAAAPIGVPPKPFREFRFSDHLIWLVVITGAITLVPLADAATLIAGNVLLFLLVLYAGRGLAVIQTALRPAPTGLALLLSVTGILLLPLATAVATLIGLADTWLDLRRRLAPPEGASP